MQKIVSYKEKSPLDSEMPLSVQPSHGIGIVATSVSTDMTDEEDALTKRKLDFVLMPLLGFCYMLQFLDKATLSYSSLLGIIRDTHLVGTDYSWISGIFYFGYLFWSFPASYLMVRMPIGKYLSISVCLWGAVLMCHAATNSFTGLMVARFFLGMTEASVAPGFSLLMGMFYKRKEQPFRHGLWFAGNSAAVLFGGVLAYAIGEVGASLAPWRLLFLVFGAITVFWSAVMLIILPDSIASARFLSQRQKEVAIARVETNNTGAISHKFEFSQFFEALRDPFTWLIFLYAFAVNLPNGGLTAFGSLVIKGFGYTGLQALLLQMPSGATQLFAVLIATYLPSRFKNIRVVTMFYLNLISLVGMALVYALPATNKGGRLGGYCLCTVFAANIPLVLSLISSNIGGFTKKATVNAILFIAYCAGNIAGPQFYKTNEAPRYTTGITSSLIGFTLAAFFLIAIRLYLPWANTRKERAEAQTVHLSAAGVKEEHASDRTDWQRPDFRYVY